MNSYFDINDKKLCNGCGTCALRCPKSAIKMLEDAEGFLYPVIDEEKCIKCNLCKMVCANINDKESDINAYVVVNKDENELKISSSGGMFYILVKYVIKNKGVVFGVRYDENLHVMHSYSETLEGCKKFCGSKYVRSDLKNTYKEVEGFLKNERMVLYTGTACQLSGLKKYLGKEYDNLILCDVLCHANPSPKVFELYKKNLKLKYNKEIRDIKFRSKDNGYKNQVPIIEFKDGSRIEENSYFKSFVSELINRPSCYSCVFASKNRITDFTIADFWGIEKVKTDIDISKGVSLVLINSKKGRNLLNVLKDELYFYEVPFEIAARYNHFSNVSIHKKRNKFFYELMEGNITETNIIDKMNIYTKVSFYKRLKSKLKKCLKVIFNKIHRRKE